MPPRPRASLDDLTVPKTGEPPTAQEGRGTVSIAAEAAVGASPKNYAHTLSLRLTAEQYRRLRHYVRRMEDEGQGRVTHQSVIEAALGDYLAQRGG